MMKSFIALSLCFFSFSAFSKTTIYSFKESNRINSANYFYITSFSNKYNHCYIGHPEEVCEEVKRGEAITKKKYSEGAHDYFEVLSCEIKLDQVTVQALLFDDYTDEGQSYLAVLPLCD